MTRQTTAALFVALACGAVGAAHAQSSDLERFEAAAEAMSAQMFALIAEERPAVAGALPETECMRRSRPIEIWLAFGDEGHMWLTGSGLTGLKMSSLGSPG